MSNIWKVTHVAWAVSALFTLSPLQAQELDPGNPKNPYDYVGSHHNASLDEAIAAAEEVGSHPVTLTTAMIDRISDYVGALGIDCPTEQVDLEAVARQLAYPEDPTPIVEALGPAERDYYFRILETMQQFDEAPEDTLDALRGLESEMMKGLSEEEAAPMLMMSAVGRYSYVYWRHQAELGDQSPWLGLNGGGGHLSLIDIATADAIGAVVGGAIGAGGGIIGSIGGAIVGASVASAIAAMLSLFF